MKNESFGSRTLGYHALPAKVIKCVNLSLSPVSITWTCVILYGRRLNFLIALHALVSESCDYSTNPARDFRGKCKLAPISSAISSVNTMFCLAYFMSKEDPAENTSFTNSKIFCGARFQTPECLWLNLVLYHSYDLFSHKYRTGKSAVQVYISASLYFTLHGNTKQIYEWSYKNIKAKTTDLTMSIAGSVTAVNVMRLPRRVTKFHGVNIP